MRRPCGALWEQIQFHADRFLPLLGWLVNFQGQPENTQGKGNSLDSSLFPVVLSPEPQLGHHLGQLI